MLSEFDIAPEYLNVNQGSYGSTPRRVREATESLVLQVESNPDLWYRLNVTGSGSSPLLDMLTESRAALAAYLGANVSDVVFVDNASHGLSAVLRSVAAYLSTTSRKSALRLDLAYGEVRDALEYFSANASCDFSRAVYEVPTSDLFPEFDDKALLARVEASLDAHPDVGFAVFSHITSTPGILLPVRALAELCHERGVLVLIDGAHAPGQIRLDVPSIGADWWVGNGHKHLFTSRGVALLWASKQGQDIIKPLVIDTMGSGTPFEASFNYQGTTDDNTRYAAAKAALDWRLWVSGGDDDKIIDHNHHLALQACDLLSFMWRTQALPPNVTAALCNVQLPCSRPDHPSDPPCPDNFASLLYQHFNFYAPVYQIPGLGFWMRLTAQIYLELDDFRTVGSAVITALRGSVSEPRLV